MKNKAEIIKNLEGALVFIGQAQEKAEPQSPLWEEIGTQYENVADIIAAVKQDAYVE